LSEFTILKAAFDQGRNGVAVAYLVLLALIFVGMATAVLQMAQGVPVHGGQRMTVRKEPVLSVMPAVALGVLVLILGLYLPPALRQTIHEAAQVLR
jgi:hydrogenase-4 component F